MSTIMKQSRLPKDLSNFTLGLCYGSEVVEYLSHNAKIKSSNPVPGTGRE